MFLDFEEKIKKKMSKLKKIGTTCPINGNC